MRGAAEWVGSAQARRVRRVGLWCAGGVFGVALVVPGVWLFLPYPSARRAIVLVALGGAAVCLAVLAGLARQVRQGRRQAWQGRDEAAAVVLRGPADAPESTRFTPVAACKGSAEGGRPAVPPLPRVLPSRRVQQLRSLALGVGVTAGLLALVALAVGRPQPSDTVQRIAAAGPEFGAARVLDVRTTELRDPKRGRSYYEAQVVVGLRGDGHARGTARVRAVSFAELRPGDRTAVLYAPSDLSLGALGASGSGGTLRNELAGWTVSPFVRWALVAAWAAGVALTFGLVLQRFGRGSFARLRPEYLAARGTCVGVRKAESLTVETAGAGRRSVQFLTPFDARVVPESVKGRSLWLSWKPPRTRTGADATNGAGGRSPAVLVLDTGRVVHGMLASAEAEALRARAALGAGAAEDTVTVAAAAESGLVADTRTLDVWDPRSYWPASVSRLALGIGGTLLLGAAVLTYDVSGVARWTVGVVTVLCGLVAPTAFMERAAGDGAGTAR